MTKLDLINELTDKIGLAKNECQQIVEDIFELMKATLETGEEVKLSGFGIFNVKSKHPRKGRNPQTGNDLEITARKVLRFRSSPVLKKELGVVNKT